MLAVNYSLLAFYALPLLTMLFSVFASDYFNKDAKSVYFAAVVSHTFLGYAQGTIGKLLLPFFTAYSVPKVESGVRFSRPTVILAIIFLLLAIAGGTLYALTASSVLGVRLNAFGADTQKAYQDLSLEYLTEALTYLALLFGIRLKKDS
jgi:hypothetical protein